MTVGRVGCTANVAVGQEATLSEDLITPSTAPKRVLVVGGGPAGLEAARLAALRGHRVVLAEASADLGGAVNIAARALRRLGIADIVRWQEREVRRLGIDVRLGTCVDRADVEQIAPDVVIVATGSSPRLDGRQYLAPGVVASGMDLKHVLSGHDALADRGRALGTHALVYDDVGHYEAIAVAESLFGTWAVRHLRNGTAELCAQAGTESVGGAGSRAAWQLAVPAAHLCTSRRGRRP